MLDKIVKWAEVVGVMAVIISLYFVGSQIRQNTMAVKSATAQAVHDNYAQWYQNVQGDAELMDLSIRGMQDYSSLTDLERARFIAMFMAFCSYSQNAFYQWRDGALSAELWESWVVLMMNFFSTPGGHDFWEDRGYIFSHDFQAYVIDDIMTREPHPKAKPWGAFEIGK